MKRFDGVRRRDGPGNRDNSDGGENAEDK